MPDMSDTTNKTNNRRPLKSRDRAWAKFLARKAAGVGITPNAISVFLTTQSEEGLVGRLQQRKQDTTEGMALRTATARQEMKRLQEFDYCVVNPEGSPEAAVERLLSIIDAAHSRIDQSPVDL